MFSGHWLNEPNNLQGLRVKTLFGLLYLEIRNNMSPQFPKTQADFRNPAPQRSPKENCKTNPISKLCGQALGPQNIGSHTPRPQLATNYKTNPTNMKSLERLGTYRQKAATM